MPYLVRKLMRPSSLDKLRRCDANSFDQLPLRATTGEFRTSDDRLSTWYAETEADWDQAALAILLGGSKIERFTIIALDLAEVESEFTIEETPGETLAFSQVHNHRDITDLTHGSLDGLLKLYKTAVDQQQFRTYSTKQAKDLVRHALSTKQIDLDKAQESQLWRDIAKLLQETDDNQGGNA